MPKQKTRKAVSKRFKMTKSGKILRRLTGQDHYRMKRTGRQKRKMRKWIELSPPEKKIIRNMLTG